MKFLTYNPEQAYLLPPSVREVLGEDHICFFVHQVVERLELSAFEQGYVEEGRPADHRALLLKVWLYAYALGVTSACRLQQRVREDLALRYLAAGTGGQRRYSNLTILTALTLRGVFGLPLRQTEGFLDSLLRLMGLDLKAPDHTTLSRRNQIVAMPPLTRSHDSPICLIVDSTGLTILGCGEWNAHKHKASKKRRDWRKLHIGVDEEGFIVAAELTASSVDDASTLPDLLDQIEVPIRRFTADGAYDHRSIYDQVSAAGSEDVVIVIPPHRSAVSAGPTAGPWAQREAAIERIREVGRREW